MSTRWAKSQPTDIVLVWPDRILLQPWLRPNIEIARRDLTRIEIVTHRTLPFVWSRNFYFHLSDGGVARKLYTPLRPRHFQTAVAELGYHVDDIGREGFISRARKPRVRHR